MARVVKIVTFKGCKPTMTLRDELEAIIKSKSLEIAIELDVVPAPSKALERKLFGSPTVFIGDQELQAKSEPVAGFY